MKTSFIHLLSAGLVFAVCGCGGDAPTPAPAAAAGPPGGIEATVIDANAFPARKIEARLLQAPAAGAVTEGGDLTIVHAPNLRDQKEGPDMKLIQRAETNDFGKFKFENLPPGQYLLSVGTLTTGVSRQWVAVESGKTLNLPIKLTGRK